MLDRGWRQRAATEARLLKKAVMSVLSAETDLEAELKGFVGED
jgi:hypothetical protein